MTEERRRGLCAECGDSDVTMATRDVCFKCYMRNRREQQHPDLHNPSVRKEHLKLLKLYGKLIDVLAGLKVDDKTKDAVIAPLRRYFLLIEDLVNLGATVPADIARDVEPAAPAPAVTDEEGVHLMADLPQP